MEEYVGTECFSCRQVLRVLISATCYTCPHCGEHHEFDARHYHENYKKMMKKIYGEKPDKPGNN